MNLALISVRSSSPASKRTSRSRRWIRAETARRGAQPHLDPLVLAVEQRDVLEVVGVEVGVELAVEHAQHVAVELGGDALGVVVGRLEHARVLDEVGAHQQVVLRAEQARDLAQEAAPAARREVADRAAEERDDARALGRRARWSRWRSKSPITPCTRRPGYSLVSALAQSRTIDSVTSTRHVAAQRARAVQRVEQHARLGRGPGAQLDELDRAGDRRDLVGRALEDRALGARRVVLGQLADAVEQLGSARVVEVLGRQLLERAA